jgi:hypothetical protein
LVRLRLCVRLAAAAAAGGGLGRCPGSDGDRPAGVVMACC